MSGKPENTPSRNQGLSGMLKIAAAITVVVVASLSILLVTNTITRDVFNDYLITLLTVVVIATFAGAVIAVLTTPDKS